LDAAAAATLAFIPDFAADGLRFDAGRDDEGSDESDDLPLNDPDFVSVPRPAVLPFRDPLAEDDLRNFAAGGGTLPAFAGVSSIDALLGGGFFLAGAFATLAFGTGIAAKFNKVDEVDPLRFPFALDAAAADAENADAASMGAGDSSPFLASSLALSFRSTLFRYGSLNPYACLITAHDPCPNLRTPSISVSISPGVQGTRRRQPVGSTTRSPRACEGGRLGMSRETRLTTADDVRARLRRGLAEDT
jgi:hypothetical protein